MAQPLPKTLVQKIKDMVLDGKSNYRTAIELGLHPNTVYRVTRNIPGCSFGWPGIRGKTLKILMHLKKQKIQSKTRHR